ncbi:MAG: hypothetical protein D6733_03260 [Methanobacteriota archaeon]|nr:MAG: hypothetical protein D6733_03260 [Euryarchaeota archaeon]
MDFHTLCGRRHLALTAALVLLFLLSGCLSSTSSSGDGGSGLTSAPTRNNGEGVQDLAPDVAELVKASQTTPPPPTPDELIQKDLADGRISELEAVELTFLASYAPESLPEGYQGKQVGMGRNSLQWAVIWLDKNWDDLDEETKSRLLPFYLEPDDPGSVYNPHAADSKGLVLDSILPGVEAKTPLTKKMSVVISENPKRDAVILYEPAFESDIKKAGYIKEAVQKAYPMYETLLGVRPSAAPYIYIAETGNNYGLAYQPKKIDGEKRCRIYINYKIKKPEVIKSTVVHELFHCFQFYLPLDYDPNDERWLMEATATWSENYVYPEHNSEWEYLGGFFNSLQKDMITWNMGREYSTYTWYLFLSEDTGNPGYVADALRNARTTIARLAATNFKGFDSYFAEYALWNINDLGWFFYTDTPSFPTGSYKGEPMYPNGEAVDYYSIRNKGLLSPSISLPPLSMKYQFYTFSPDVEEVVYRFPDKGDEEKRRRALIKIAGEWQEEDWTHLKKRRFCRKNPAEKVEAILLVFSNSDEAEGYQYNQDMDVDTRGDCTETWRGWVTYGWSGKNQEDVLGDGTKLVTHTSTGRVRIAETLVYDKELNQYLVDSSKTFVYGKDNLIVDYPHGDRAVGYPSTKFDVCGTITEVEIAKVSGTSDNSWKVDKEHPEDSDAPIRIWSSEEDPRRVLVDLQPFFAEDSSLSGSYESERSRQYKDCAAVPQVAPFSSDYSTEPYEAGDYGYVPDTEAGTGVIEATLSDDGEHIKGSGTGWLSYGWGQVPVQITVDYAFG